MSAEFGYFFWDILGLFASLLPVLLLLGCFLYLSKLVALQQQALEQQAKVLAKLAELEAGLGHSKKNPE